MGLFKKKTKFETQDDAFSDLSIMFHSFPENPTYHSDFLNPDLLNYSIESLDHVDDYLDKIRTQKEVEEEWNKTVLRAGAYVGEVIRRSDKKERWHWVDYETAKKIDPDGWRDFEKSIVTCAVLYQGGKSFCFPLGKVFKFLENGREDSVKLFAKVIIENWKNEKA